MLTRTYRIARRGPVGSAVLEAIQCAKREFGHRVEISWEDERSRVDYERNEVTLVLQP